MAANDRGRGGFLGWLTGGILLLVCAAYFVIASSTASARINLRSEHADPAVSSTPGSIMVVVSKNGKTFHAPECRYIHDPEHKATMTAQEAIKEGFVPCLRCMWRYAQ